MDKGKGDFTGTGFNEMGYWDENLMLIELATKSTMGGRWGQGMGSFFCCCCCCKGEGRGKGGREEGKGKRVRKGGEVMGDYERDEVIAIIMRLLVRLRF